LQDVALNMHDLKMPALLHHETPCSCCCLSIQSRDVHLLLLLFVLLVQAGNLLTPEMLLTMARDPVVFACANPVPEIDPELAAATRPDVIMATGRTAGKCDFRHKLLWLLPIVTVSVLSAVVNKHLCAHCCSIDDNCAACIRNLPLLAQGLNLHKLP
jgi:hypothetical protein